MAVRKAELLFRFQNIVLNSELVQALRHLFLKGKFMPAAAKNAIGQQIAQIRAGKAMSQSEFAGLCQRSGWDISRETLAKIESGIRCVTDIEVLEIAAALQVPVPQLFPKNKQRLFIAT